MKIYNLGCTLLTSSFARSLSIFPNNFPGLFKLKKLAVCYNMQHVSTYRILRDRIYKNDTTGEIFDPGDVLLHIFFHIIRRHGFPRDNIGSRRLLRHFYKNIRCLAKN